MKVSEANDMLKQGLAIGMNDDELIENVLSNSNGRIGQYPAAHDYVEKLLKAVKAVAGEPGRSVYSEIIEDATPEKEAVIASLNFDNVWEEWECRKTAAGVEKRKLRKTVNLSDSAANTLNANPLQYGADIVMYFKKGVRDA